MSNAVKNGALIWLERGIVCRNVKIENIYRNERNPDTQAPTVRIDRDVTAQNLQIRCLHNTFVGQTAESIENNSADVELIF